MRAASLGPTPGSVVSCSTEAVLMLTLPAGAGLAAATASPVEAQDAALVPPSELPHDHAAGDAHDRSHPARRRIARARARRHRRRPLRRAVPGLPAAS